MRQRSSIKEILLCQHNLSKYNKYSLTTSEDHAHVQMSYLCISVPSPHPLATLTMSKTLAFHNALQNY